MRGRFQDCFGEAFGITCGSMVAFWRPWEHFWHPGSTFGGFGAPPGVPKCQQNCEKTGQKNSSVGDRVLEVSCRIDGTGMPPRDLNLIVASRFLDTESFSFLIEATRIHRAVDLDPSILGYEEIVS